MEHLRMKTSILILKKVSISHRYGTLITDIKLNNNYYVSIPHRYGTPFYFKSGLITVRVSIPHRYGTQQHFVVSSILPPIGGGVKFNCIKITP